MYIPNSSSELITYAIMLLGAILLGFLLGFYSNLEQIKAINALIAKTYFDIDKQKNKQFLEMELPANCTVSNKSSNLGETKKMSFQKDNLKRLFGIDTLIEEKLNTIGISTFRQLQLFNPLNLKHQLTSENEPIEVSDIIIWQQQAALAAANHWDELNSLREELNKSNTK